MKEELKKADESFSRHSVSGVLEYNKQYRKENPDKYGYNTDIVMYIQEKEGLGEEYTKQLEHEVYLSQGELRKEQREEYKKKMLSEGWLELTEKAVEEAEKNGQKMIVNANMEIDWYSAKLDGQVFKPYMDRKYGAMLMKPRATRKGIWVERLKDAFYKIA